jgi:hypothetical protein
MALSSSLSPLIVASFCSYATSVFPIGAMFAMTLWLGNTAYLYISVAFAQMLKAVSKKLCRASVFWILVIQFNVLFEAFIPHHLLFFQFSHSACCCVSLWNNGWIREAKPTDAFYNVYH